MRQAVTPGRLLGRANAGTNILDAGVGSMGALIGGALGGIIGSKEES
jgi:hypothetical protein